MKKETKNKLLKVWNKIKKPLMIFSIIGNILFLMTIIIGCSTSKKQKTMSVSAENEQVTSLTNTTWIFNNYIEASSGQLDISSINYYFPNGAVWGSNDDKSRLMNRFRVGYNQGSPSSGWCCGNGNYLIDPTTEEVTSTTSYTMNWAMNNNPITNMVGGVLQDNHTIKFIGGSNHDNVSLISYMYANATLQQDPTPEPEPTPEPVEEDVESVYLGDNFIPSVYITQGGDYIYNGFGGKHLNADTFVLTLNGFTFKSNNETYNTIKLVYGSIGAVAPYVTQDGSSVIESDGSSFTDYMVCIAMQYQYYENSVLTNSVTVMRPRRTVCNYNGSSINAYDVRPPFNVYINENYRKLDILEDNKTIISGEYLTIENKTAIELLQVTSNVSQDVMGFSNVFGLMASAFGALASILGITILPGVTLGLLMFIPLIVIIIISVVRIIKK